MEAPSGKIQPEDIELVVSVMVLKNGQVFFQIPPNPVQAYGLLCLAMDQVQKQMDAQVKDRKDESRIIRPLPQSN